MNKATRAELPDNPEMDKHRQAMRDTLMEYLRDKTTREERKEILKAALTEWFDAKFGAVWFSFQMIVAGIFCYLIYLYLTSFSAHK